MAKRIEFLDAWGYVLVLLGASLITIALVGDRSWGVALAAVLQSGTAILIFRAAGVEKRWFRAMVVLAGVAVLATVVAYLTVAKQTNIVAGIIILALLTWSPIVIAERLRSYNVITMKTVYAVLCIFIILGMFFGVLYQVIDEVTAPSFFAQIDDVQSIDFLYFSFVTLTTLGYGDLSPAGDVGRTIAVIEALLGQLYLVTIVALVVSNLGHDKRNRREQADIGEGHSDE